MIDNCNFYIKRRLNELEWSSLSTSLVIWIQLSIWLSNESSMYRILSSQTAEENESWYHWDSFFSKTHDYCVSSQLTLIEFAKAWCAKSLEPQSGKRRSIPVMNERKTQADYTGFTKTAPRRLVLRDTIRYPTRYSTIPYDENSAVLLARNLSHKDRRTWIGNCYQT